MAESLQRKACQRTAEPRERQLKLRLPRKESKFLRPTPPKPVSEPPKSVTFLLLIKTTITMPTLESVAKPNVESPPMMTNRTSLTTRTTLACRTRTRGKLFAVCLNLLSSRLIQNRKSAMKCRLKKKAEFEKLKEDFNQLKE